MIEKALLYKILANNTGAEVSASGNPAIMSDTLKNNPMNEMKVYGWSKQETTTGAQLFPTITPSTEVKSGITVEYMEHGKIHISGTSEKTVDFMTPTFEVLAGTYTLSMGVNINNTLMRCTLSTTEGLPYFDILNNEASKTETTEDNMILYLLLRVYGGKTIDITIQPMLNTGTSPLPWEPYTGGQPSPNPEYPQDIVSAGMKWSTGKNLFSGFVFGGTSSRVENGIITTKEGASYIRSDYIPCEVGKHYVYNIPKGWRGSQTVFCNSDKKYIGTPKVPQSFNVPEDTAYFAFQIAKTDTTPIYQADLEAVSKLVQVEQADACTEYEPYTGGVPKLYSDKIGVTAHGKNLFDLEYALKQENWNTIPGRYYYIPYYVGKGATVTVSYDGKPALGLGAYVLVGRKAGETRHSYGWLYHSSVQSLVNNTKTFVAEADYIYINGTADYINMFRKHFKNFQIEVSPSPTAYEPYHEPQSLSIQTPTGLPAIPVDSDGNYTDADGQQWIADYIDLKRGKYVQWVYEKEIGEANWGVYDRMNGFYLMTLPTIATGKSGISNQFKILKILGNEAGLILGINNSYIYSIQNPYYDETIGDKGLSNWKAHLTKHPLVVMTYLDEPIERDLTPSEIQAYQELTTYAGTTILENDAECYMEVSAGGGDSLRAKKLALILGE